MRFKLFSCCSASLFACFLVGCQTEQPSQTVDIAPLSTQIGNLSDANADLKVANERLKAANDALTAENARLLSMLRADADAGQAANLKGWLPFERYVWGHQLALLPDIVPDKTTADRWNEASTLYAEGGESAMQGVINTLNADAKKTNETLGTLREQVDAITKERDAANEAATAALAKVKKAERALAAAVDKALQDEAAEIAKQTREWQIHFANWAGCGLFVAALGLAAAAWFLSAASGKLGEGAIIAFALCVGCFAFARFLGNAWFMPIAGGLYGVAFAGWIAWKIRTGIKEREAAKTATDNALVTANLVPALDDYYDNQASPEAKADMAEKLFPSLESLGGAYDAAVKRLKASQCDITVSEIKASIALEKSGDVK